MTTLSSNHQAMNQRNADERPTASGRTGTVTAITPQEARARLQEGKARLVDVREPVEHRGERIEGATLMPLSRFDPQQLPVDDTPGDQTLILHCKAGSRSRKAAEKAAAAGLCVCTITGGIDAWKQQGLPTQRDQSAPIDLIRQVHITVGSLILIGAALAMTVSPWFWAIPTLMGVGLLFAGVTGFCGMAMLLSRMPWNRVPDRADHANAASTCCAGSPDGA